MIGARWSIADLADTLEAGFRAECARLDLEQAVHGLDALEELQLHPLLAMIFDRAGYGTHREQRYPADRRKRRESEGERCDFVLTPERRPLRTPDAEATLFQDPDALELDEAFWLEVKVVQQFLMEGANQNYASQLLSTVRRDVTKLGKDPGILHAGLLIVLFVREATVFEHDLGIWQDRCLERGLPITAPSRRGFPIRDRLGNGWCGLALYGVSRTRFGE